MLNDRRQRLLHLLLMASGPLSAAELGRLLGYPARSVRYDLEAIADWVKGYDARLVARAGVGYYLEGDLQKVREALSRLPLADTPPYEYVLTPRERVRRILLLLLGPGGPHRLRDLAARLGVGRSTVYTDLAGVEAWLRKRGLELVRAPGIRVEGSETAWRRAMTDLVMEELDEGQLAMLLEGRPEAAALQSLLRPLLPQVDWPALGAVLRDAGPPELVVYLTVMLSRVAAGHTLPPDPQLVERVRGTWSWQRAHLVCSELEKRFGLPLSATERAQVAVMVQATHRAPVPATEADLSDSERRLVRRLASLVQTRTGVPVTQDPDFLLNLALHLRPIRQLLGLSQRPVNPFLDEIRSSYAPAYRVAEEMARILEVEWGLPIPVEEVGFLALHVAAAIERARLQQRTLPRAVVVCGAGLGTSQLLLARLRAAFPGLMVNRVVSALQLGQVLAEEPCDLVITTCRLLPCDLPVVQVSPFLTEDDIARIRRTLAQLSASRSRGQAPALLDLLTPATVAVDAVARTWEEAVAAAGSLLVKAGLAEGRYVEAMLRTVRELGPYVVVVPGVAVPHARPEDGVRELGMALVRLRTPVYFGHPEHDPVDLVIALGAVDSESHLPALMQLWEILESPRALADLRSAPDVGSLLERLAARVTGSAATPVPPCSQK